MFDWLWNVSQDRRIGELSADRRLAERQMGATITDLERRVEHLTLSCAAMWSLLKERHGLSDDDLAERVRQLDLTDGRLDGVMGAPARRCDSCGRTVAMRRGWCPYCGATPPAAEANG